MLLSNWKEKEFIKAEEIFYGTKNTSSSAGIFDPAIAQVKEKIEGRVDGDQEMIDAHQNQQPLEKEI